jgi:hypothetical protein
MMIVEYVLALWFIMRIWHQFVLQTTRETAFLALRAVWYFFVRLSLCFTHTHIVQQENISCAGRGGGQ